jgi:hypothetical protein
MLVRRIQMKTSTTPGELPGTMQHGEIAANLADALLYVGVDGAPPVVIGGSSPSVLDEGMLP